ncbi:MAG TPA: hypothetical protein PLU54_07885 [Deltaproteobacteria bacterium]|nr:hypothetical protein [Deltaproteobacteria bacterium]
MSRYAKITENLDWGILLTVVFLICIGLLCVFSSTSGTGSGIFIRQLLWICIGTMFMVVAFAVVVVGSCLPASSDPPDAPQAAARRVTDTARAPRRGRWVVRFTEAPSRGGVDPLSAPSYPKPPRP